MLGSSGNQAFLLLIPEIRKRKRCRGRKPTGPCLRVCSGVIYSCNKLNIYVLDMFDQMCSEGTRTGFDEQIMEIIDEEAARVGNYPSETSL